MSGLCQGASPQPRSSATIITMLGGGEVQAKGRRKRLDERVSNMVVNLSLILCVRIGPPYIREVKSNWSYINCCTHTKPFPPGLRSRQNDGYLILGIHL